MRGVNVFLAFFNAIFLWAMVFVLASCLYIKHTWGSVSLAQVLFFIPYGGLAGIEQRIIWEIIGYCVCLPIVFTWFLLFLFKRYKKGGVLFFNRVWFAVYLICLWLGVVFFADYLRWQGRYIFYFILFAIYLLNQWRSFSRPAVTFMLFLAVPIVFMIIRMADCDKLVFSASRYNFEKSDFYLKEYVYIGHPQLKYEKGRNIIIVFGESLEKKFLISNKPGGVSVKDEKAVKFANFTEGYAQRWTQGALFSAFTGTHIHYISDLFFSYANGYIRYLYDVFCNILLDKGDNEKVTRAEEDFEESEVYEESQKSNNAGMKFDFMTPNIRYLGDITADNGYQNLFVQGGDINFSGTKEFLLAHGFKKENIYARDAFREEVANKKWIGADDKSVFKLFKEKIIGLDKEKPFLAVMFTLDLHVGENPFYKNIDEIQESTVNNFNDFIQWFEQQDFYKDTTLIILADHRRMGSGVEVGGGLYNAFFNLPEYLRKEIDTNRKFNQIDVFPTILEIAGFELPWGKAGVGVSLFSKNETIAERFSYEEQENIFSSLDKFYYKIWQKENIFLSPFDNLHINNLSRRERFIAHAGGVKEGKKYLNNLEAITASFQRGYKYIELDLLQTKDGRIIAAHDWQRLGKLTGIGENISELTFNEMQQKIKVRGGVSLLSDQEILDFFVRHSDRYLVTDKLNDFALMAKIFAPIKNRMIVEVFSPYAYKTAKQNGFLYVAYNISSKADFNKALANRYNLVTIHLPFARKYENEVKKLREFGIKTMLFTAEDIEEIEKNSDIGDVFYYDGEDVLYHTGK